MVYNRPLWSRQTPPLPVILQIYAIGILSVTGKYRYLVTSDETLCSPCRAKLLTDE